MVTRYPVDEPDVIADVLFASGDERLVIAVDGSLSHREVVTAMLTDLIATSEDSSALLEDIRELAASLSWTVQQRLEGTHILVTVC